MSSSLSSTDRQQGLALIQAADASLASRFAFELSQDAMRARVAAAAAAEERRNQLHERSIDLLESITDPQIHARAVGAFADLAEAERIRAQADSDEKSAARENRTLRTEAWWSADGIVRQVVIAAVSIAGTAAAFYFGTGGGGG